jgi:hypothetical protein
MFRKAILGLSAALILTAAVAPTAALAHGGKGKGHHNNHHNHHNKWDKWSGGYGGGYNGGYGSCWVKQKVWSDYYGEFVWQKINVCY